MAFLLIIDDDPASCAALESILRADGHRIITAGDGAAGLAIALAERPDLIITDLLVPALDGYALARRVRAEPGLAGTRVIFATAACLADQARALAERCGVAQLIAKPPDPHAARAAVAAALAAGAPAALPDDPGDPDYLLRIAGALYRDARAASADHRQSARLAAQANASRAFAAAGADYQALLNQVAQSLVENLGDFCIIRIVSDDGQWLKPAALYYHNPADTTTIDQIRQLVADAPLPADQPRFDQQVFRSGQPLLAPVIDPATIRSMANDQQLAAFSHLAPHSMIVVPLRAHGQPLGMLTLYRSRPAWPAFDPDDLLLAQDLADRAGLAISGARLVARVRAELADRQRAEETLRQEQQRFTTIVATVPEVICSFQLRPDGSTCMPFASPRMAEIYDGDLAELQRDAEPFLAQIHPDDIGHIRATIADSATSMAPWRAEWRLAHPAHGTIWMEGHSVPQREPDGSIVWHGLIANISERRRAEQALREMEHKLRALFDLLPVGVSILDASNRVVFVNPALERITKITHADMLAGNYGARSYIRPDGSPMQPDQFASARVLSERRPIDNVETGIVREDGSAIWTSVSAVPVDFTDWQVVLVTTDITDRKGAEDSLRHTAEQLRRSNTELEQFAYVASHDLQEPLRAVAGMVQLLQQRYQGQLDARADQYIAHAVEGATRMQTLINDLLAFSRIDTRARPAAQLEVGAALDAAIANLAVAIRESGTAVTRGELPTVLADAGRLTQLFQNLLSNAIKFRGDQPPAIHISAERQADGWRFAVADNGIGIAPEYFERIFVVFQRLHTRRAYPGNGIGLAICKKIVERHGGRIWVTSTPGHGTTFWFTLPDRRPPDAH